jgi:hypothetical protein
VECREIHGPAVEIPGIAAPSLKIDGKQHSSPAFTSVSPQKLQLGIYLIID